MRTMEELRNLIIIEHGIYDCGGECLNDCRDFGEILCYHIHELNMPFRILAEHFKITLDELAEVIADHIRRL